MEDYLRELCNKENIRLVYTNNKRLLLSSSFDKGTFVIRSHISFKFCPKNVAEAIVKYYYSARQKDKYINIIETYIKTSLKVSDYLIKTPQVYKEAKTERKNNENKQDDSYKEMQILRIVKKNFWGDSAELSQEQSFEAESEDVIELNIIVAPFDT